MLVLSRKTGESIQIGDDITVTVRRVSGGRVTLAIHAPRHVRILRGELEPYAHEFQAEGDRAGQSADDGPRVVAFRRLSRQRARQPPIRIGRVAMA